MGKKKLIIFPYNGNGLEAIDCLGDQFELIGFADDTKEKQGRQSNGFIVFDRSVFDTYKEALVLAVPGSHTSYLQRRNIIGSLNISPPRWATVIHPGAHVSPLAGLSSNTLIMAGVTITSNAIIGQHVCILPNTVIHHGVRIGDYSLVGSNVTVAGNTIIEENCYIGSGTSLINGIVFGAESLAGLGSNIIRNVPAGSRIAGNPAKALK